MTDSERIARLEAGLDAARAEIDRLRATEAIRDCLYRLCRGIDRLDADILRSAFHPGATIDMGALYQGVVEDWWPSAVAHQATQRQRQHMLGNILIRIDGESALAESYELDRHKSVGPDGAVRDLVLAARSFDRFERRDGEWRIVARKKVMDWGREISADDALYRNSPLETGGDDRNDPSYAWLT